MRNPIKKYCWLSATEPQSCCLFRIETLEACSSPAICSNDGGPIFCHFLHEVAHQHIDTVEQAYQEGLLNLAAQRLVFGGRLPIFDGWCLGLHRARSLAVLALPGLFDAQPLLAALDDGFANLPDDRDAVAAAVWPDMRVVKYGFCRERLVVGQLL